MNDDPTSTKDEYGYLAAVPAANYLKDGKRYVSPIVYQGIDKITNWFGTVDDTTQYLIDDWDTYLGRNGLTAEEYIIPADPIEAAAAIAKDQWASSSVAVVTVDGSGFSDEIETVIDKDDSLSSTPDIQRFSPGSSKFKNIGGKLAVPQFIGKNWGAIHLVALGDSYGGDTSIITPRFVDVMTDNWPHPYDVVGPDTDSWYPISIPGLWIPYISGDTNLDEFQVIKYPGDRYPIDIRTSDCSLKVTIETAEPSSLIVYLIDPNGNIRRPTVPMWNGGEVNPLHYWNGGNWEHDFDEFRRWVVEPHADYSVEVHNPMTGTWNALVLPGLSDDSGYATFNGGYHIKADIRKYNPDRLNAALSAANAAVIASAKHAPLLYVTKDSIPSATTQALSSLGATNIIFINIDDVSTAQLPGTVTEYSTLQQVIDAIKAEPATENFITITSLATGDGYFAPSGMIAAYHTAPVLNIGEAKDAYNKLDQVTQWRGHSSEYYHGCRTRGHVPLMDHPFSWMEYFQTLLKGNLPGFDFDLHWYRGVYLDIYNVIDGYGLDRTGREAYLFVSPRHTDIGDQITKAMTGNNSYAGHIPVETTGFASAHICRNILYPAVIFANPGRIVISSCFMNFRDGNTWKCNDGKDYPDFVTQKMKQFGFSHGRFFEGHAIWSGLLERYNTGAALIYHCSHGTGGSGICCLYENIEEQFPLAEPTHEHLKDFDWWDGWKGYYYDNVRTKTPREGGLLWVNAKEPNLYDIVHFKWCDQLWDNLHSEFNCWMSCTTGSNFGPEVYLEHGAALWFGNGNTGLSPQSEVMDSYMLEDLLLKGLGIGESLSNVLWLHQRDYTTGDPTTIYGISSLKLANEQMIFGDPTMTVYSPDWIEPVPITATE
ncbi:MAG: hypothetical protein JSV09_16175 [Thermoplasmata archaeon]|nr:MAG: hypothetical protein JSV09_16175 [Thermoplasmata archaeon]